MKKTFSYSEMVKTTKSAQVSQKIIGRESEMIKNDGGGFSFKTTDMTMLDRFLNLGATSGTFYLSRSDNQYRNYDNIVKCIKSNGVGVVSRIAEVSSQGLAQKNDHAIFALALVFCHGDNEAKRAAMNSFNNIVRTGTHMFMFCEFIKMRGFGKLVRTAINNWYTSKNDLSFATQISKYQNRNGWSHRDVFRLSHPRFSDCASKDQMAKWAMGKEYSLNSSNPGESLLMAVDQAKKSKDIKEILELISKNKLQREHIPTEFLNDKKVQEVMLPNLGGTALLRNLGNMSKSGLLSQFSEASKYVVEKLADREFIKQSRLHPLSIFVAQRVYSSGVSQLGSGSWTVNTNIVEALEDCFYLSFDLIEPTGKNYFYGLDISGSMGWESLNGIKCCEVSAIMAMAGIRSEKNTFVGGFGSSFVELGITKKDTLASATKKCVAKNFGSTNPSAAIEYATRNKIPVDAFVFITDNDINSGRHPTQAFKDFKQKLNKPNAKMIACSLTASNFTFADPEDPNQLDISGFSPDLTSVIASFTR